jgi:NAD(P)-dependent dehydrogenase (short-subunit alcohol dehydrogenase family)
MKSLSTAVITGVSTGIGYETARTLAGRGFHVFGSVRRSADADRLKAELGDQFTPLQPSGKKMQVSAALFFLFDGEDMICERPYFDEETIARQLAPAIQNEERQLDKAG